MSLHSTFLLSALSEEPRAPSFVKNPDDVKEEVGSEVILNCAANGNPEPVITWLKDGATIDLSHLDSRFTKIGKGSLQIRDLQLSDKGKGAAVVDFKVCNSFVSFSGTYMCRAENSEDSVDSAAYVDVQMKPRFSEKPSPTLAVERSDVELACEAFGMPEPTVQWYKNGDLLIESDYFQVGFHFIQLLCMYTIASVLLRLFEVVTSRSWALSPVTLACTNASLPTLLAMFKPQPS